MIAIEPESNKMHTKKNHFHKLDKRQTFTAYIPVHKPWDNQRAGYIF